MNYYGCGGPTGYVPPAASTTADDIDVSSLTASGPVTLTVTTTTSGVGGTHHHAPPPPDTVRDISWCGDFAQPSSSLALLASQLELQATNITSPGTPTETKAFSGGELSASIPLGARFTLTLQDDSGGSAQPLSAFYGLGSATLTNAQIDPSLYPTDALLEFDASASAETKTFQAVHLGSQPVVITPDNSADPREVVTVNVIRPDHLGTANGTITFGGVSYNLDDEIVDWADKRGIPPQLIKGIIDRETAGLFNPMEWRYEPLTTDWDDFSPLGDNKRRLPMFAPYRLEYDAAHPRGWLLVDSEDVHLRSRFYAQPPPAGTPHKACAPPFPCIADPTRLVSAYTIVRANDFWQHWRTLLKNQRKRQLIADALIANTLAWSAQTTVASSYGLMQVLFERGFDAQFGYAGINGQRRPYYLFDVPSNIAVGGGSIPLGSGVYVYQFRRENGLDDIVEFSPQYATPPDLDDAYQNGLMGYNDNFCIDPDCYGPDTMRRISQYPPVTASSIFP